MSGYHRLGVDIGGTFTDFALFDEAGASPNSKLGYGTRHKLLSVSSRR